MTYIVVVIHPDTGENIAYAACKTFEEAQEDERYFDRLFEEDCIIEIRRAVVT